MKQKLIITLFFFVCINTLLLGQTPAADQEQNTQTQEKSWIIKIKPRMLGLDFQLGFRGLPIFPTVDTTFWIMLGGAYETAHIYRTLTDEPLTPLNKQGIDIQTDIKWQRFCGSAGIGISQGLILDKKRNENLVEIFAFYKTRYDYPINEEKNQIIFNQIEPLPDAQDILQNSLLVGFLYDSLEDNKYNFNLKCLFGKSGFIK